MSQLRKDGTVFPGWHRRCFPRTFRGHQLFYQPSKIISKQTEYHYYHHGIIPYVCVAGDFRDAEALPSNCLVVATEAPIVTSWFG
jgi:hypothetical protein